MGDFCDFLEKVKSLEKELRERKESRRALEHMLELVAEASDFIGHNTSSSILGESYNSLKVPNLNVSIWLSRKSYRERVFREACEVQVRI